MHLPELSQYFYRTNETDSLGEQERKSHHADKRPGWDSRDLHSGLATNSVCDLKKTVWFPYSLVLYLSRTLLFFSTFSTMLVLVTSCKIQTPSHPVMLFSRRNLELCKGLQKPEITITVTMGNNILRATKVIPCLLISVHIIPTEKKSVAIIMWSH